MLTDFKPTETVLDRLTDREFAREWLKAQDEEAGAKDRRIADLEAAAKSALAQLNSVMDVKMPGHAAGALVHARETLKSVVQ